MPGPDLPAARPEGVSWLRRASEGASDGALAAIESLRRIEGWKRTVVLLLIDALTIAASLSAAYLIRFEGEIPTTRASELVRTLPVLVATRQVRSQGKLYSRPSRTAGTPFHGESAMIRSIPRRSPPQ